MQHEGVGGEAAPKSGRRPHGTVLLVVLVASAVLFSGGLRRLNKTLPKTPRPLAPDAPALHDGRFYRAKGHTATLLLPPLDSQRYSIAASPGVGGEVDLLTIFLGKPDDFDGYVAFIFYPRQLQAAPPPGIVFRQAQEIISAFPFLKQVGNGEGFLLPGGSGFEVQLAGRNEHGTDEVVNVVAVTEGNAAVGVIFRGGVREMKGGGIHDIANGVLAGLLVGDRIERLPVRSPKVALSGVYATDGGRYVVFDERGHVLELLRAPTPVERDLEAAFQAGLPFSTYDLNGTTLVISDPAGGAPRKYRFEQLDGALLLDGTSYRTAP